MRRWSAPGLLVKRLDLFTKGHSRPASANADCLRARGAKGRGEGGRGCRLAENIAAGVERREWREWWECDGVAGEGRRHDWGRRWDSWDSACRHLGQRAEVWKGRLAENGYELEGWVVGSLVVVRQSSCGGRFLYRWTSRRGKECVLNASRREGDESRRRIMGERRSRRNEEGVTHNV